MKKDISNREKEMNDALTDKGQAALKRIGKKKRKKLIKTMILCIAIFAAVVWLLINSGMAAKILKTLGLEDSVKEAGLGKFFRLEDDIAETKLTTYTVGTRTITQVLSSTGTIEPNDQYSISGLVSGEILEDYFSEGDTVIEDQILYRVDSDNLSSSITRAENSLKNANTSLEKALERLEKLNIESDYSGTIKKLYIEEGDEINQGTLIADIIDDETMCIDIPFMEVDISSISVGDKAVITFTNYEETFGYVSEIAPVTSVNHLGVTVRNVTIDVKNTGSITTSTRAYAQIGEVYCTSDSAFYYSDEGKIYSEIGGDVGKLFFEEGERIEEGMFIARLESEELEDEIENLEDRVEEAKDSLEDAKDAVDNYNIKAPITGKVISKSYKTGDTLSAGQGGSSTLAVIYDMSALKFTMSIDELDIDKLDEGQDVIVTCDSRAGKEYHGTITNISIQGTTTSGTTVYPVEVTIENVEDESKRTVAEDGTVNKVYMTGMTSSEKTYNLISKNTTPYGTEYKYSDDITLLVTENSILDGDKELNRYLNGTYTIGSNFYDFSSDYSTLTLEVQNDKQMLRPGMNIDAEIIVEERENVIAVPLSAVGRGNVVKVIKNKDTDKALPEDKAVTKLTTEVQKDSPNHKEIPVEFEKDFVVPEGATTSGRGVPFTFESKGGVGKDATNGLGSYGTADKDTEYDEIRVSVGISDNDFVEIISGLNIGDVVILETRAQSSNQMFPFGMAGSGPMMGGGMGQGSMMGANMGAGRMPSGNNMGGGMRGGFGGR